MFTSRQVLGPVARKRWLPIAIIGLIAVTAGIAFPQALPSAPGPTAASVAVDATTPNKLVYTPPSMPEAPDAKGMLTRLGLATAGVLALCVGSLWVARRWLGPGSPHAATAKHLRLTETLSLGNRCALHLVQVGNRQVLIAADPSGLKSVVPLNESFDAELLSLTNTDATPSTPAPTMRRVAVDSLD